MFNRSREGIHVLGPDDLEAFEALTGADPVVNVFVEHRARTTRLEPRWLGGEVWGLFRRGELVAACHVGANLVPVQCDREQAALFGRHAMGHAPHGGSRVATIVGPQDPVAGLWESLAHAWGPAREERWEQCHLALSGPPRLAPDPLVVPTRTADLDTLYPACVAMYKEEVGADPEAGAPRGLYLTRVRQLVERGWSFSRIEDGRVVFKAEVACATPAAAQVQGVWVAPDRRGEGLSAAGMAAVAEHVRRDIAPAVGLYVNAWNQPARRAYARAGFEQTATFATVMF